MKAKKKYGQHFLIDQLAITRIAQSVLECAKAHQRILEIGPGKGALTTHIRNEHDHLKLVEIDPDMVNYLLSNLQFPKKDIIEDNVLNINPYEVFDKAPFVLCGNFPYNISSQILFWMMSAHEVIPSMVGMFQKEVALRIAAKEGNKQYGILSVLVQSIYDVELILELPSNAFSPPPKVDSAVIVCKLRENAFENLNFKVLRRIVKTSFNQRRKMISNTLKHIITDKEILNDPIFSKRPEQLSVEAFVSLSHKIEPYLK